MSDIHSIAIISHEIKADQAGKQFVTYIVKGKFPINHERTAF